MKECELQMEVEAPASNAGRYFLNCDDEGGAIGNVSGCYIDDYDDEDDEDENDSDSSETNFKV